MSSLEGMLDSIGGSRGGFLFLAFFSRSKILLMSRAVTRAVFRSNCPWSKLRQVCRVLTLLFCTGCVWARLFSKGVDVALNRRSIGTDVDTGLRLVLFVGLSDTHGASPRFGPVRCWSAHCAGQLRPLQQMRHLLEDLRSQGHMLAIL